MSRVSIFRISLVAAFLVALAVALPTADSVHIQFLGTGHPNIDPARPRLQTGIVVDVAGDRWLLDAGAGTVARLYDHKKAPDTLKHIFISHLHYDHCVDLDAVLWQWRSIGGGRDSQRGRRLTLWGPDGLEEMLSDLYNSAYKVDGRGRSLLRGPAIQRHTNRDAGVFDAGKYK
ncbi:MAG: MBL fold metallo-hydrolase, partial [bacterium]|nr:MBL fold metallo-hydrolase [bacterium]